MAAQRRSRVDIGVMMKKLATVPGAMRETMQKVVQEEAKGFIKTVVSITPPASQGVTGSAAKKQGEASIDRDLAGVFVPVRLKGKRVIPHLFGDVHPEGVGKKPPYTVETTEVNPDLEQIYNTRRERRHDGRMTRGRRQAYYVSDKKLKALEKRLKGRVGTLAAGYNKAAERLGVSLPAWVKRHGNGHGSVTVRIGSASYEVVIGNSVSYARAQGLHELAGQAARIQQNKLDRRLPFVVRAALKKAGLQAA